MPVSPEPPRRWDLVTDILMIGCGFAGAIAAIEAVEAGREVLVVEKVPHSGGISICSGGGWRAVRRAAAEEPA